MYFKQHRRGHRRIRRQVVMYIRLGENNNEIQITNYKNKKPEFSRSLV